MKRSLFLSLILAAASSVPAEDVSYRLETVSLPEGVPPEVGALGFSPSGTLFVALRRSDVLTAIPKKDPSQFGWKRFASGLHNACGMVVLSDREIIVSQMAELTRIVDEDGDGSADLYESLDSSWGMSGNYHETNHLVSDGEGGFFVAIGTASHNGPVFSNVRGEYSKVGRRGRNFSAASWKGWILHIDSEGTMTPWASGFRMHNGIFLDGKGNLWAGDNQGDWKATTPLYHVKKGGFYGHPASLVWDPEWDAMIDPLDLPLEEINSLRTQAAILLPHQSMNRSASEPTAIPEGGAFGPFGGQMILPDNNGDRLTRIMVEEVDGVFQGAAAQFYEGKGLNLGNNRVVFSPDEKTLYVGQTSRGWGQLAEGVQRITYTGEEPFDIQKMAITPEGFRLIFTKRLGDDASRAANFSIRRFRYEDTALYGGEKLDEMPVALKSVQKIDDRTLELAIEGLEGGGWVYELKVESITDGAGERLRVDDLVYTVNRVPNG